MCEKSAVGEEQGPLGGLGDDLGAKRRNWHGKRGLKMLSYVRQGTQGQRLTPCRVCRHACAQSLWEHLSLCSHSWCGDLWEKRSWPGQSPAVVRAPEDQYGELWHWPLLREPLGWA